MKRWQHGLQANRPGIARRFPNSGSSDPDAWVFPSAKFTTPLGRDNAWRGILAPRLKTIQLEWATLDRKSTRLNSSHGYISYAVFCLKKKKNHNVNVKSNLPVGI